jgi:hypothetical protein
MESGKRARLLRVESVEFVKLDARIGGKFPPHWSGNRHSDGGSIHCNPESGVA